MSRASSQLRVFVHFNEDTVFAGEDIECTITFKNVEATRTRPYGPTFRKEENHHPGAINPLDRLRAARSPSQVSVSRRPSILSQPQSPRPQLSASNHKYTSSFSVVESANKQQTPELPGGGFHIANAGPERKHGRKVSIVSLGVQAGQQRPSVKHGRSTSLQQSGDAMSGRRRPSLAGHRAFTMAHPQSATPQSLSPLSPLSRPGHTKSRSNATNFLSDTPESTSQPVTRESLVGNSNSPSQSSFTFPHPSLEVNNSTKPPLSLHTQQGIGRSVPSRKRSPNFVFPGDANDNSQGEDHRTGSLTKVFSVRSMDGTPRSSVDMYSTSNHSNETLMSELPAQARNLLGRPQLSRSASLAGRPTIGNNSETILMGYAQLSGVFTLDGSLVNQAPFEDVKRKAVVGGQGGGGVIGITRPAADAGLFGSLSWNSIGESIGGLMGVSGPSSMKEMKGIAEANSVPLLSTSKSILFVDLNLQPGESSIYNYRFTLPRGLPPSHKGRAMKVAYNLIVGTHRNGPRKSQQQMVRQVEVPFRVLSGVDAQGDYLGHDLMSPYIILKDQARSSSTTSAESWLPQSQLKRARSPTVYSSAGGFRSYVDHLLNKPQHGSSPGLLSPTAEIQWPRTPQTPQMLLYESITDATLSSTSSLIDAAIRQSTNPRSPIHSPTNFIIARSSIPIASLTISRPALKLGDTLTCVVDFANAKLPCYAFEASLESSERVDPTLAIRSAQSVERATRRVWTSHVENAIWARRCVFRAQVPVDATPAFTTSGVSLEWCIRLELVVGVAMQAYASEDERPHEQDRTGQTKAERILEVAHGDERGTSLVAKQHLRCDSFEVEIPIRVYGAVVGGAEDEAELEGLAV